MEKREGVDGTHKKGNNYKKKNIVAKRGIGEGVRRRKEKRNQRTSRSNGKNGKGRKKRGKKVQGTSREKKKKRIKGGRV